MTESGDVYNNNSLTNSRDQLTKQPPPSYEETLKCQDSLVEHNLPQPNRSDRREPRKAEEDGEPRQALMQQPSDAMTFSTSLESVSESRKKLNRSASQTYDGVFSNLTARPEIMVLPKETPPNDDQPPPYTPELRSNMASRDTMFVSMDELNLADCIDEVYLDNYPVGGIFGFFMTLVIVLLFQAYGFLVSFIFSQSHATRYGSFAGLGLLLAITSFSMEADLEESVPLYWKPWVPIGCVIVGIVGYIMFVYSLTSYQRIRKLAESVTIAPRQQARFSTPTSTV